MIKTLRNIVLTALTAGMLLSCSAKDMDKNIPTQQIQNETEYFSPDGDSLEVSNYLDSLKQNDLLSEQQEKTVDYMFKKEYYNQDMYEYILGKDSLNNLGSKYVKMLCKNHKDIDKKYLDYLDSNNMTRTKSFLLSGLSNSDIENSDIEDEEIISFVMNKASTKMNRASMLIVNSLLRGDHKKLKTYVDASNLENNKNNYYRSLLMSHTVHNILEDVKWDRTSEEYILRQDKVRTIHNSILNLNLNLDKKLVKEFIDSLKSGIEDVEVYNNMLLKNSIIHNSFLKYKN